MAREQRVASAHGQQRCRKTFAAAKPTVASAKITVKGASSGAVMEKSFRERRVSVRIVGSSGWNPPALSGYPTSLRGAVNAYVRQRVLLNA